ncbi:MAG: hypothetical protein V4494_07360 [Chlamydiota bacterium]
MSVNVNSNNNNQEGCIYQVAVWKADPYFMFHCVSGPRAITASVANTLFKNWKKNIQNNVDQNLRTLINLNIIKPIHITWLMSWIFNSFIKEKIQLYQLQRGTQDIELDMQWEEIENILSKNFVNTFNMNIEDCQKFSEFCHCLEEKLNAYRLADESFLPAIRAWTSILRITYVSNMQLVTFLENKVRGKDNSVQIKLQLDIVLRNINSLSENLVNKSSVFIPNMIRMLESFDSNENSQYFNDFLSDNKHQVISEIISNVIFVQTKIKEIELLIFDNTSLKIFSSMSKTEKTVEELLKYLQIIGNFSSFVENSKKTIKSFSKQNILPEDLKKKIEFDKFLEDLQLLHIKYSNVIGSHITGLNFLLLAFLNKNMPTNDVVIYSPERYGFIDHHRNTTLSLKPQSVSRTTKVSQNLTKNKKNKNRKKSKPQQTNVKQNKDRIDLSIKEKSLNSSLAIILKDSKEVATPTEERIIISTQLMQFLYAFQQEHPRSVYLEQAIWHMERMLSLHHFLEKKKYSLSKLEQLNTLNAMTSSAHIFLEQLYNFDLVQRRFPPLEEHNLKLHFVSESSIPKAIELLHNGNSWTRYFYSIDKALKSMTTQRNEEIPPLVRDFVALADGKESVSFSASIKEIFNTAIEHGTFLLNIPGPVDLTLPKDVFGGFSIEYPIPSQIVDQTLNVLQSSKNKLKLHATHPAQVHLKQSAAALKMLNVSLKMWNTSESYIDLVTWTGWSLQQLQEAIEQGLRAFAKLNDINATPAHEIKLIAQDLNISMGKELRQTLSNLSYKPRYPVQYLNAKGAAARLIDEVEALRKRPEFNENFRVSLNPKAPYIWEQLPTQTVSGIGNELTKLITSSLSFLQNNVLSKITRV